MCNIDPTLEEVNDVVMCININLYELDESMQGLSLSTDGFTILVEFGGQYLWNSDDDPRGYEEDGYPVGLKLHLETQLRLIAAKVLQLPL